MYDQMRKIRHVPTVTFDPSSATDSNASNASNSPPLTRESSPSPTTSPTPALFSCPPLSRSFSANSSANSSTSGSTISQPSVTSRSSSASTALRQRGYVRPQGVNFAPSAGNRDSVLSLGSIAHLQYYFARTGLLDGKGGQLAKETKIRNGTGKASADTVPRVYDNASLERSPVSEIDEGALLGANQDPEEPLMLPPTVSTYNHKVQYTAPPPDSHTLRQDLRTTLKDAKKALQDVQAQGEEAMNRRKQELDRNSSDMNDHEQHSSAFSQPSGWYEIQGLHILDVVTLAIRAAKIYYTSHEDPQKLYSIKSERQIRLQFYEVLDVLKRMASRNFAGGMKEEELGVIMSWVNGIEDFLVKEEAMEAQEKETRDSWTWLRGSWEGQERERERLFLNSFLSDGDLPEWTPVDVSNPTPTPFLEFLRTGLTLVHLHNALLRKSKRQFGDIKTFHTDTAKPYRCAENLRYWIKASEIRWETKLTVNVSGVVNSKNEAYSDFDTAVFQWSKEVREQLTKEWKEASVKLPQPSVFPDEREAIASGVNES